MKEKMSWPLGHGVSLHDMKGTMTKKNIFAILIFPVLSLLIYSNNLHHDFMIDDYGSLLDFKKIQSFKFLQEVFSPFFVPNALHYRPIYQITNMILYHFLQDNPFGYHVVSITLFSIYCIILFIFLNLLTENFYISLMASMLFCVHPINGMVVNYITSYVMPMAGIFLLLSLINLFLFLKGEKQKKHFYFLSIVFFLIGLFSYEQVVLLPAYLLCILYFIRKCNFKEIALQIAPYFFVAVLYLSLVIQKSHVVWHMASVGLSIPSYIASVAQLIFWYVSRLIDIRGIVLIFSMDPIKDHLLTKSILIACLVLGALLMFLRYQKRDIKYFSISWFLIGFLPLGLITFIRPHLGLVVEPHWFYFSSMGYFLFLAVALFNLKSKINQKIWVIFFSSLLVFYGLISRSYNVLWQNTRVYCRYWANENPKNPLANLHLAMSYAKEGDFAAAMIYGKKLLENKYYAPTAYNILGLMYGQSGDHDRAKEYFIKAIEESKGSEGIDVATSAYINLGVTYALQKEFKKAEEAFLISRKLDPESTDAARNLARLYIEEGRLPDAAQLISDFQKKHPDDKTFDGFLK